MNDPSSESLQANHAGHATNATHMHRRIRTPRSKGHARPFPFAPAVGARTTKLLDRAHTLLVQCDIDGQNVATIGVYGPERSGPLRFGLRRRHNGGGQMRRTTGPRGRENTARDALTVARRLSAVIVALLLTVASRSEAKYGGGAGTPEEPYRLCTAEHLRALAADVDDWDRHFLLMADVDMNDVSHAGWLPIGDSGIAFTGTFDGADKTISNFNCVCPGCRRS